MSSQANAWQTARAPQKTQPNARNTSPQTTVPQGQRQERAPLSNVWARNSQSGERSAQSTKEEQYTPANGFNAAEVKAFLSKVAQANPAVYKSADTPGTKAPLSKGGQLANGQSLFSLLAKQAASLENGG